MQRDMSQQLGDWNNDKEGDWGQNVIDTFHLADFFIDLDRQPTAQLERIFLAFHGDPKQSPRRDEFGMYQAYGAARRSADMSRQVGAAISIDGNIVATGTNEVPRAGGGLYWSGDPGDARDVALGFDANVRRRREVADILTQDLSNAGLLAAGTTAEAVLRVMERGPIGDIIEYVRAVHAEMAALTDAVRRGVLVQGATLYCTTFPCHHCARHIVAAGIKRVVFVAPYPKSLAEQLHNDSLVVGTVAENDRRIPFQPFFGVGPRRYIDLFSQARRRLDDGTLRPFDRTMAPARIMDLEPDDLPPDPKKSPPPYINREIRALAAVAEAEAKSGFRGPGADGSAANPPGGSE
jgi:cytidine deaminase